MRFGLLPERAADRNDVGSTRQRERIGGMFAAHGVEQQREVFDVARHRALHAEIAVDRRGRRVRDAADARPQADDAAEARGVAQAAAHVGAMARATPCRSRAPPPRRRRSRRPSATCSTDCSVAPNTSLNVLAPAPNSGVFDIA